MPRIQRQAEQFGIWKTSALQKKSSESDTGQGKLVDSYHTVQPHWGPQHLDAGPPGTRVTPVGDYPKVDDEDHYTKDDDGTWSSNFEGQPNLSTQELAKKVQNAPYPHRLHHILDFQRYDSYGDEAEYSPDSGKFESKNGPLDTLYDRDGRTSSRKTSALQKKSTEGPTGWTPQHQPDNKRYNWVPVDEDEHNAMGWYQDEDSGEPKEAFPSGGGFDWDSHALRFKGGEGTLADTAEQSLLVHPDGRWDHFDHGRMGTESVGSGQGGPEEAWQHYKDYNRMDDGR